MLDRLVGSGGKRELGAGRGLVVAVLHGLVIFSAIRVTTVPPPPEKPEIIDMVLPGLPAPVPPASPTAEPSEGAPVVNAPPPDLLAPPVEVPTTIPPVKLGPPIDPEQLRHIVALGTPTRSRGDSTLMTGGLAATQVDEPAVAVHQPSPRYPPVLQAAGLEGRVLVQFIIDTTGHLEPASFRVLETSHPGFNAAAEETVQRSVFRPARVKGKPVRQRTMQSIAFRITSAAAGLGN